MQLLSPVLISRLLQGIQDSVENDVNTLQGFLSKHYETYGISFLLFMTLNMKTFLENQYLYSITGVAGSVRGAVTNAVFNKILTLKHAAKSKISVFLVKMCIIHLK